MIPKSSKQYSAGDVVPILPKTLLTLGRLGWWQHPQYSKISQPSRIRLLALKPGTGNDQVNCSFFDANLDDPELKYECLSYTWGQRPLGNIFGICLDGRRVHVRKNLYFALYSMRYPDKDRILWVDALCINQRDMEERSAQVLMMTRIYAKSQRVLVWLGLHSGDSRKAVDFLQQAWEMGREDPLWLSNSVGQKKYLGSWKALLRLLGRVYWHRVWIVQEVTVATDLMVYVGDSALEWWQLAESQLMFIKRRQDPALDNPQSLAWFRQVDTSNVAITFGLFSKLVPPTVHAEVVRMWGKPAQGAWFLEESRRQYNSTDSVPLLQLLSRYYIHFSGDPRDKIYGLLGLARESLNVTFDVDYTLSHSEVLIEAVRFMIEATGKLNVVLYGGYHLGLPSWLPFWGPDVAGPLPMQLRLSRSRLMSKAFSKLPLYITLSNGTRQIRIAPMRNVYIPSLLEELVNDQGSSAAGCTTARTTIVSEPPRAPIMVVSGCIIDTIAGFLEGSNLDSSTLHERVRTSKEEQLYQELLHSSSEWLSQKENISVSDDIKRIVIRILQTKTALQDEELIEAIWRTLIHNRDHLLRPAEEDITNDFFPLLHNGYSSNWPPCPAPPTDSITVQQHVNYYIHLVTHTMGRKLGSWRHLFLTSEGLLGLSSFHARKGDSICVLLGCDMPVAVGKLRKDRKIQRLDEGGNDFFGSLYGSVYLYSYMDGQAINKMESGHLSPTIFRLT